ncbi:MAG TPA: tetratricopeptide repeat protein, partial [Nannocystaceae bacterium]|nr:tetratricopeptide repeat protein [Nannocystaceae bacterium]
GNDAVVFDALAQLAFEAGTRANELAAAEAYAELALAFVTRSRRGDDGRGRVLLVVGQTRERAGDIAGARTALQASEAAFAAAGTLDLPGRLPLWIALALVDELDGDLAGAERRYDDARRRIELAYGDNHPDVAVALEYLAIVRRKRGAYDEALAAAERSRTIRSAVLGDQHNETAVALDIIGNVNIDLRRWDEAETALGAAIAIWRAHAPEHRGLALAEGALAEVHMLRGQPAEALLGYRKALALAERTLGDDHPELAIFLVGIGSCELALGRPGDAIAPLERAARSIGETRGDPMLRAHVEVTLAQALVRSGGDRQRARTLVDAARRDNAKVGQLAESGRMAQEIDATAAEL